MKNLILLSFIAIMIAGCDANSKDIKREYISTDFSICTIDSCEYIVGLYKMSHKGNCKFCSERKKQELRELFKEFKAK
jgi:hypothetical protein